jgi:hypothetical protein
MVQGVIPQKTVFFIARAVRTANPTFIILTLLCRFLLASFFLGLLLYSEDGGDMFLRKVGIFPTTRRYNPEVLAVEQIR